MKSPEKMTPDDIVDELHRWANCHKDAPDNYDARLLKSAANTIDHLLSLLADQGVMYRLIDGETVWGKHEDSDDLTGEKV